MSWFEQGPRRDNNNLVSSSLSHFDLFILFFNSLIYLFNYTFRFFIFIIFLQSSARILSRSRSGPEGTYLLIPTVVVVVRSGGGGGIEYEEAVNKLKYSPTA